MLYGGGGVWGWRERVEGEGVCIMVVVVLGGGGGGEEGGPTGLIITVGHRTISGQ